jgi:HemY protein
VALTRAELQLEAGAYSQALATLDLGGRNLSPAGLDLKRSALFGLKDWQGLAMLLPELKKQQVMTEAELRDLERGVWVRLFDSFADQGPTAAGMTLGQTWQQVSGDLKRDPMIVRAYCQSLMLARDHEEAEKVLLKAQRQHWDSQLARLYAYIETDDPARQLGTAENWLDDHRDDAQLQLCLGRLAARNALWGKAREYFEESFKLQPGAEACAELGRLLAAQGEQGPANIYYRQGLVLAEVRLPELPMPETPSTGGGPVQSS